MKVIIMAGGYGTRLQPMTLRTPKCILPLGDKNSIMHFIGDLSDCGITDFIISLNETQTKVKEYLDSLNLKVNIKYCFEKTSSDNNKLGAIGALLYLVKKFGPDDYLILGADNYIQGIDYKKFINYHEEKNSDVTIALYELNDIRKVSRFGIGIRNEEGRIIKFQEKPKVKDALSNLASTFVYYMSKNFIENYLEEYVKKEISDGRKPDNVGDLWAHFCKKLKIYGFTFSGFWGDVGQSDYYVETNRKALDIIKKNISQEVIIPKSSNINGKVIIEKGTRIGNNVMIIGPCFIGRNVVLEDNSMIGPYATVLHNTIIGSNNTIVGSIIFGNVVTGNNVKINHAIIDGNTVIHDNCKIHENAMIGFNCVINSDSQILYGSKIWPFLHVDKSSVINSKVHYKLENTSYRDIVRRSCYWQ